MKMRHKKFEVGYKNRIAIFYESDTFCLIPTIGFVYDKAYDYISRYESISIIIQFAFFGIKFEHKYNIKHE